MSKRYDSDYSSFDPKNPLTPLKAMRAKCLDCCAGSTQEVKLCPITGCSLYPYRAGKHPTRTGRTLSPEEKKRMSERLAMARLSKNQQRQHGEKTGMG